MSNRGGPSGAPDFGAITLLSQQQTVLDAGSLFVQRVPKASLSAVDDFIENTNKLNLLVSRQENLERHFSSLILLGYVSAVESYIRKLVVGVLGVDEVAQRKAADLPIPYGASLCSTDPVDFAEALLETSSLASHKQVVDALKNYLGVSQAGARLEKQLSEYDSICHARHCCVHRFGRLGVRNAIALGLDAHGKKVGGPFAMSTEQFDDVAQRLRTFVKAVNNVVWEELLKRTATNKDDRGNRLYQKDWMWNWNSDKKRFTAYWKVFASEKDSVPSRAAFDIYQVFRDHYRPKLRKK